VGQVVQVSVETVRLVRELEAFGMGEIDDVLRFPIV
jgi:hypothetical protein